MIYTKSINTGDQKTGIRIGEGYLSFPHLFVPEGSPLNPEPKYSTDFLIPKTNTEALKVVQTAIKNATERGIEKHWNGKKPTIFRDDLIKDGDAMVTKDGKPNQYTAGCWVIKTSSNEEHEPRIYDARDEAVGPVRIEEEDTSLIHGGSKGYLMGSAIAYDTPANKGVKIYLNAFALTDPSEYFGDGGAALAEALAPDTPYDDFLN